MNATIANWPEFAQMMGWTLSDDSHDNGQKEGRMAGYLRRVGLGVLIPDRSEEFGDHYHIPVDIKRLYAPSNDHMRKNVELALGRFYLVGEHHTPLSIPIIEMIEERKLRRFFDGKSSYDDDYPLHENGIKLWVKKGQAIAHDIIANADETELGLTGSDFGIDFIYSDPLFEMGARGRKRNGYVDPSTSIMDKVEPLQVLVYRSVDGRIVGMSRMEQMGNPKLCLIGPDNSDLEETKNALRRKGRKPTIVTEEKFKHISYAFGDNEFGPGNYKLKLVPGTVEGYIRSREIVDGVRPHNARGDYADLGIDVVERYFSPIPGDREQSTVRKNGLNVYSQIMPTFPVLVYCTRLG